MTTWELMPWKRWSPPYRIGILLVISVLSQGASCIIYSDLVPSFTVPGVTGKVTAEILYTANGVPYYKVLNYDDGKSRGYRYIYPGNPDYDPIVNFFHSHPEIKLYDFTPQALPGGAGSLPQPPVQ